MDLKLDIIKTYDKMEWQFLETNNVKTRLFKEVGGSNNGLYNHNIFFCSHQWCTEGFDSALKRAKTRVPSPSISVHNVCRGFLQSSDTSRKSETDTWAKIWQQYHYFPFVVR